MKKILVMSDSHASLRFMRQAIHCIEPNAVVHLGDHYDDAQTLELEYPQIPFHMVFGNCDRYRCPPSARSTLCYDVCGVRLFMTHGHLQSVKQTLCRLNREAREFQAAAALYGHTHSPDCHREEDGLWVINPGSCGSAGGSVALLEVEQGSILSARIIPVAELV